MAGIRFENVTMSFAAQPVIQGLDLSVQEGEFFTFVGPSGCGKSTVLNLIAGLTQPTTGRILFDGQPVDRLSPRERDVAMVFQSYALYPHLTKFENIAFPLRMRRTPAPTVRAEVGRVADLLGLTDLLEKKPRELSGGQRQRTALGRAIIRKPTVFLMDEPLSNLDARLRIEMRSELKRLHRELGITTVYVTHDQAEAMGLSDRIAVLSAGKVRQCDAPQAVYRNPANTFVAGFIGSPAMNLVRSTVHAAHPLTLDCLGALLPVQARVPAGTAEVLVGIRPEDALVEAAEREGARPVTVSVVEPAGPNAWVDVVWEGTPLTTTAKPDTTLRPGDKAYLVIATDRVSLFDVASGERIP